MQGERIEAEWEGRGLPIELFAAAKRPAPAVLVIPEVFGLNDDIRGICRRFAQNGYTAAAADVYRGGAWTRCVWRRALALRTQPDGGAPADELDAALRYLEGRQDVSGVGAVGFCMGGGFALCLGTRGTARAVGAFYGDVPTRERMAGRICPVVAGYGGADRLFAHQGERLGRELAELGLPHDVRVYPGVGHSYMNQHEPSWVAPLGRALMAVAYDEEASEDSWARMLAFFAEHLRPDRGADGSSPA